MKRNFFITLLLVLLTASYGLTGQEREMNLKRKVAIGRFSNETQYSKSVFYDKENDPMGKQAADILATRLAATDKFLMVENQDYGELVNQLEKSGAVSGYIGADYLIIGSVTEYGRKTVGQRKVFSSTKEQIVEAAVAIRLVDVSTGLVVYSGEAKGEASSESRSVMGLGSSADYDATLADKAISAAITQLVNNIVVSSMENPWKAYILAKEEGVYFISGGESQGIQFGDEFAVYERGNKVENPQTGLLIELPGKEIGKIRIDKTVGNSPIDELSLATLIEGSVDDTNLERYYIAEL